MVEKISFAVDFLTILGLMNMQAGATSGFGRLSHAASLLFLVDWGLTTDEVQQATERFIDRVSNNSLDSIEVISGRVVTVLADHDDEKKRLMWHLAAIAALDSQLTDDEAAYLSQWGELLDFTPEEIAAFYSSGAALVDAMIYFAKNYMDQQNED